MLFAVRENLVANKSEAKKHESLQSLDRKIFFRNFALFLLDFRGH